MDKYILCVDDEKIVLDSLRTQLHEIFGNEYSYEIAENGEEALEVIDDLVHDGLNILIIVSDWLMPGMKGDDLLINIHKKYPQIVKVLLTGQADESAIKNAQDHANLFACLKKPWKREELQQTIKQGLKQNE